MKKRFTEEQIIRVLKRLRELETENSKLKRLCANAMMDIEDLKAINSKNW